MEIRSSTMYFGRDLPANLDVAAADDYLDGDHRHPSKRSRLSPLSSSSSPPPLLQQWNAGNDELSAAPAQYNPLDEPTPLGLRLRKSPSLLDLIQMRLSQSNSLPVAVVPRESANKRNKKDGKGSATSSAPDKMKASNFMASLLRIGTWEYISKHEGDLVAKCYFAKKKLVWEVLEGGLKSKIEIQWSDIVALNANCPDNGPGTMTVVLARQPLFFRETNPQPRKHTLWQSASDFTDDQASIHRQHFLQCPNGMLNKHYEKLIQSDQRLNLLNQLHEVLLDEPYFDTQASVVENQIELRRSELQTGSEASPILCFPDGGSPSISELSSLYYESWDSTSASLSKEAPSPSSDSNAIEGKSNGKQSDFHGPEDLEQLTVMGIRPSMSATDLVNHLEHHLSEQVTSGNIPTNKASECQGMLDDIAQILFGDTQHVVASDEKLMKKVDSLCCLLQDPAVSNNPFEGGNILDGPNTGNNAENSTWEMRAGNDDLSSEFFGTKQTPSISGKDSVGELLLNLPRIASFPKFLFDIAETDEKRFRG